MRERFLFLLHFAQVPENGHAFVEDGASGKGKAVLRKVAGGHILGG